MINNLAYADDRSLLAPSAKGLQKLLDICEKFSFEFIIEYNFKKAIVFVLLVRKSK